LALSSGRNVEKTGGKMGRGRKLEIYKMMITKSLLAVDLTHGLVVRPIDCQFVSPFQGWE
jgi:hypothetical protein